MARSLAVELCNISVDCSVAREDTEGAEINEPTEQRNSERRKFQAPMHM